MADVFGVSVVAMIEDEGAALGGALQAAWALALRENRKARITDFTSGIVALDEATRCQPNRVNVARYRELQALQDQLKPRVARRLPGAAQAGGCVAILGDYPRWKTPKTECHLLSDIPSGDRRVFGSGAT